MMGFEPERLETRLEPNGMAETQGFEPWIQVLARMLP
jgi:hypothetical protein